MSQSKPEESPISNVELTELIRYSLLVPMGNPASKNCVMGLPLVIWGPPGIGKSTMIEETGASLGLDVAPVIPATNQPEDFAGALIPDGKGGATRISLIDAVNSLSDKGSGILFLDEISCARPAVQSALLSLVLYRRCGEMQLPPPVRILAAANPPEEAAGGWDLEPPMANRFAHCDARVPTVDKWSNWMISGAQPNLTPLKNGEDTVRKNWPTVRPKAVGTFIGFMKKRSSLLYKMPEEGDPARSRAWPSPRSWEFAMRASATCAALGASEEVEMELIGACVGTGAMTEFIAWRKKADLPDPQKVLEKGWKPDKRRLDRTLAVYSSIISFVLEQPDNAQKLDYAALAWERLSDLTDCGLADIAIDPVLHLVRNGLGGDGSGSREIKKASRKVTLHLAQSGLAELISE